MKRTWRVLPFFCFYCAWAFVSDLGSFLVLRYLPRHYLTAYLCANLFDSVLQILILIELAWSILRPFRFFATRQMMFILVSAILIAGAVIWPITGGNHLGILSRGGQTLIHMEQTDAILRLLVFLVLTGCSQMLAIGWRNRELQVATGLGFCSFVSLTVAFLQSRQTTQTGFGQLNEIVVASYICSLAYWIFCFAQEEPERRPFTPRMQQFLLAVAGNAHAGRLALASVLAEKPRPRSRP